jgi:hypothetical protein
MPTSTSSKIKVGVYSLSLLTTEIAKEMRDNSPPEATELITTQDSIAQSLQALSGASASLEGLQQQKFSSKATRPKLG